jgi:hypothetical protein
VSSSREAKSVAIVTGMIAGRLATGGAE